MLYKVRRMWIGLTVFCLISVSSCRLRSCRSSLKEAFNLSRSRSPAFISLRSFSIASAIRLDLSVVEGQWYIWHTLDVSSTCHPPPIGPWPCWVTWKRFCRQVLWWCVVGRRWTCWKVEDQGSTTKKAGWESKPMNRFLLSSHYSIPPRHWFYHYH